MKIAVFGAGAIGGILGAYLSRAGEDVTVIARGAHLAAIKKDGLHVAGPGGDFTTHPAACADGSEAGPQEVVFVTMKAHSVAPALGSLTPMSGPDTVVVWAVNGVPWWYFYGHDGDNGLGRDRRIEAVDPGGLLWDAIGPERIIGCVVHPAAEVTAPGTITHIEGDRFSLGEPNGEKTARLRKIADALIAAGLKAPVRPRIRDEIWIKLWGNLSFNPVSALTGATLETIATDPGTRALIRAMMVEAQEVAEKLDARFAVDVDKRIEGARAVGAHKTSMLQDLERGRPMEIEALIGAVAELGRMTETPMPNVDAVLALIRQRAKTIQNTDGSNPL